MVSLVLVLTMVVILIDIIEVVSVPTFLVFLALKLSGTIIWSWWLVCLPLLILFGCFVAETIIKIIPEK